MDENYEQYADEGAARRADDQRRRPDESAGAGVFGHRLQQASDDPTAATQIGVGLGVAASIRTRPTCSGPRRAWTPGPVLQQVTDVLTRIKELG